MKNSSLQLNWNPTHGVVGKVRNNDQTIRQNTYRSPKQPIKKGFAMWKVVAVLFALSALVSFLR